MRFVHFRRRGWFLGGISEKNAMWSIHRSKYKEIIRLLVQLRKEQGVTQCQLARNMHLRQGIISKIETCERRIDLLELINYCRGG